MNNTFEILHATRKNILNSIEGLSVIELNTIPKGFNNNIIWNVAHIVVTQQLLCYGLSNNKMNIVQELIDEHRKGTAPKNEYSLSEIEFWKEKLVETAVQMEKDFNSNVFVTYSEYPTSYNVILKSIEGAIAFNNTHEALHFGYIMALKRAIL